MQDIWQSCMGNVIYAKHLALQIKSDYDGLQ